LVCLVRANGVGVLALDGDVLRAGLCQGLGFSDADRAENLRRAAEAAKLGMNSGLCVVASFITPLESHRRLVAGILDPHLSFIHVSAPLEVCRARDVKGLYAGATAGKVAQLTGVSSGFEAPTRADLTLATATQDLATCQTQLAAFARQRRTRP
jgi:adenylylsulfate kinase-like enzyme